MGRIADEHVEWAVVNRLKAMLEEPPKTTFNVTQSFALFSTVLLWTKQRAWAEDNRRLTRDDWNPSDWAAHSVREQLRNEHIIAAPWQLSRRPPTFMLIDGAEAPVINAAFDEMTAEAAFKWLRDALAHGDGRTIAPIHKPSSRGNREFLAGFRFEERRNGAQRLCCSLYDVDMRRMGTELADRFCRALSGLDRYEEYDVATASIEERAA
jgi:hypothetical protein